jgi:glycosyltransferase involved in cell wall biosynthesis
MALKSNNHSLAIIIPMFNEEKVASKCIDKVIEKINKLKTKIQLIVVNDGSIDNTSQILKDKKQQYKAKITVLTNKKNMGFGGALQTGIKYAISKNFEYYLTMDSDLTNPPSYISDFVKIMPLNYDCIKASRYIKGGRVVNVPYFRRIISIVGNSMASLIFNVGIRDCTNGFKMVKLKFLKGIQFKENNFSIILEEMYYLKKKHAKFYEIPNVLYARSNSKSHFRYRPKIFYDYFKYLVKSLFV